MTFRTGIGTSDADSITLMGRDLASELMGNVTLTELTFLMVQRRDAVGAERLASWTPSSSRSQTTA